MIRKFIYGTPFNTEAVTTEIPCSDGVPAYGTVSTSGSPDSGERRRIFIYIYYG